MLKKRDILLLILLLVIGLLISFYIYFPKRQKGAYLEIKINGTVTETYPLNTDIITRIDIGKIKGLSDSIQTDDYNYLQIKDGTATITDANCKDKFCVHQKGISAVGESIICLPHLLTITVVDESEDEPDAIAVSK